VPLGILMFDMVGIWKGCAGGGLGVEPWYRFAHQTKALVRDGIFDPGLCFG
jgi:hypothetical protein